VLLNPVFSTRSGKLVAAAQSSSTSNPEGSSMNTLFSRKPFALLVAVTSILSLSTAVRASDRPYAARGTAQFISATEFTGSGLATHLGIYNEAGLVQFSPTPDPTVLQIDACTVYTSADGDQLHARISGQLNGVTGVITATVTYVGGTGRVSAATGTAALTGQLLPGGKIEVAVEGSIQY
jgi:hypothetical protein